MEQFGLFDRAGQHVDVVKCDAILLFDRPGFRLAGSEGPDPLLPRSRLAFVVVRAQPKPNQRAGAKIVWDLSALELDLSCVVSGRRGG